MLTIPLQLDDLTLTLKPDSLHEKNHSGSRYTLDSDSRCVLDIDGAKIAVRSTAYAVRKLAAYQDGATLHGRLTVQDGVLVLLFQFTPPAAGSGT